MSSDLTARASARAYTYLFQSAASQGKSAMRHRKGRRASLLCSAVCVAAAATTLYPFEQANAQQAYSPILAGPVIGGVSGIPVRLSGFIDIVPGPSMAVVAAEVSGFETVGGSGSGGGAGMGGALFVGTGAIVNITSSRFTNNIAKGGTGGNGSLSGGSLNGGGIPSGIVGATSLIPGIPGLPGVTPYGQSDQYAFGDGNGNGLAGTRGGIGFSLAPVPFTQGGQGGQGGQGQNGWATNPVRIQAVTDATQALSIATQEAGIAAAQQTISIMMQTADAVSLTAATIAAAAAALAAANPLDAVAAALLVTKFGAEIGTLTTIVAADALQLTNDAATIAAAGQNVTLATQQLTSATQSLSSWIAGQAAGIYGKGGEGGKGGKGGNGGFGASGGAGGNGGQGGIGFGLSLEADGGDGGEGGISGFGAGGAQGGNGGFAGLLGVAGGQTGQAGLGGVAGFGGGVGSSGTGLGVLTPQGGGGGSGLGGAIFVQTGGTVLINGVSTFMGNAAIAGQSLNGGPSGQAAGNSIFLHGMSQLILGATPLDFVTFIGPQSIADNSAIQGGGVGLGSVTVAAGTTVMAPGTTNQYTGTTTVGSILNPLGIPGELSAILRANDGDGLPSGSKLEFTNAGILQTSQNFNRYVGDRSTDVQWTGSGGFAYWNGIVTGDGSVPSAEQGNITVTLSGNTPLFWGAFGFVPVGSALVFGAPDATGSVTFTNSILTGLGGLDPLTSVRIVVIRNKAQENTLEPGRSIPENIDYLKYTGQIIGLGGVTFNDLFNDGKIYLLNKNLYLGPTFLSNGELILQGKGEIAPTMLLNILNSNAVFDITGTDAGTSVGGLAGTGTIKIGDKPFAVTLGLGPLLADFGGTIEGSGTFDIKGGYQRLSGLNTYTGVTTIHDGAVLDLSGTGSILASVGLVNNGTFNIGATTAGASIQTMSGHGLVTLGNQYLTLTNANDTFSGVISDTGGLILAGGQEILTGVNTYTGTTDVQANTTLKLVDGGSIANSDSVRVDGTMDISGTTSGTSLVSLTGNGSFELGTRTLTLSNAHDRFDGVVSGSGDVSLNGGTQVLGGVNTYTGKTSVATDAALVLTADGAIAQSSGVKADGLFDISTTNAGASITTLSGDGVVNLGAKNLSITIGSDQFAGVIGGAGALNITGGTQTLSGLNLYQGVTTVADGATLALKDDGAIEYSAGVVADGLFDISGTTTGARITTLSGSGTVDLGDKTLTLTAASGTFSGVITDPPGGALVVAAGTQTLSGVNTYTGQTSIAAGAKLALTGAGSIAQSGRVVANGLFDVTGIDANTSIISLAGSGIVDLGAKDLTITGADDTFAGIIGNAGGLSITGGKQTLSGANVFGGAAKVAAGATLALSGAGTIATASELDNTGTFDISASNSGASVQTLLGNGQIVLGANTLTLTNADDRFDGTISGEGGLAITAGHETLTGESTYLGGTYVSNATVTIDRDAALGDVSGGLTLANAALKIDASFDTARNVALEGEGGLIDTKSHVLGLSSTVSGEGTLFAQGGGRINLTGVNSYAGGTTISGGTVVGVNGDAALGDSEGSVRILDGKLLLLGDLTSARDFYVGTNSTIEADQFALNLSGPIYLERLGWNTLLSGTVAISGGSWSLSPTMLTTGTDALVSGVGTITMPMTINGTLKPGNSPGTMNFAQDLTLGNSASYVVAIDGRGTGTGAGNFSRIVVEKKLAVSGTLSPILRDISGSATNTFTPAIGDQFVVATAGGGVTGTFSSMVQPASGLRAGSRLDALYTKDAITLYAVPVSYTNLAPFGVSLSRNQLSTAGSLDALRPVPGVRASVSVTEALRPIYGLRANQIAKQLDHLSATGYGDALLTAIDAVRSTDRAVEEQMNVRQGMAAVSDSAVAKQGDITYWMAFNGGNLRAENVGQTRFHSDRTGVLIGVDKQLYSDLVVGATISYSNDKVRSQEIGSYVKTDAVSLGGYMSWKDGNLYINNRLAVSHFNYSSTRNLDAIAANARGKTSGWGVNGSSTVGYRYKVGGIFVLPEAGVDLQLASRKGLTEFQADAVSLAVRSDTETSLRGKAGLRLETSTSIGDGYQLSASLRGVFAHELAGRTTLTSAAFIDAAGTPMQNLSVTRDRSAALVGGGLSLRLPGGATMWARYNADLGANFRSQSATAGLRWSW
jgi:autotransporter-associated beta strand protein